MRQLNNAASKRSQINHERKFETQEDNQILLIAKNMELKGKVADLETEVAKFKTAISNMMEKRATKHVQSCPSRRSLNNLIDNLPQFNLQNDPWFGVETNSILLTRKEPESPTTKFK